MHQSDRSWCSTCSDSTVKLTSRLYIHWSVSLALPLVHMCSLFLAVRRCTLSAQEEESFMALTAQSGVLLETKPSAVAAHGNWGPVESSIRAKMTAWLFVRSLRTAGDGSGVKATRERVHRGMKEDLMLESVRASVLANDGLPLGALFPSRSFSLYSSSCSVFLFSPRDRGGCWVVVLESVKDAEQGKREERYGKRMSGKKRQGWMDRQTDRPPDRHLISSCGRNAPSFSWVWYTVCVI